jgi:hypothetical protein
MAFEQKPGFGALFTNTKKKSDKEPIMRGELMTPDGKLWEVGAWGKTDKNGNKMLSLKASEPFKKSEPAAGPQTNTGGGKAPLDDEIPFAPM